MSDFRARIIAELDTAKAEAQLNQLKNANKKMDIQLNFITPNGNLNNILQALQNQAKSSGANAGSGFASAFNSSLNKIQVTNGITAISNLQDALKKLNFDDSSIKKITDDLNQMNISVSNVTSKMGDKRLDLTVKGVDEMGRAVTVARKYDNATGQLVNANQRVSQSFGNITNSGRTINAAFSSTLGSVAKFVASYMSIQRVFSTVKNGITTIVDLDTALVDLQKTCTASFSEMNSFYSEANTIAKEYGATTKQIIQSAADWSRLGYNLEDSKAMAKYSSQFASISPGMSVDTATSGLVSIMKAFDIEAKDALDGVLSKVNAVGNGFAVTNDDIVTGLEKSSSAMVAANNTFDQTVALLTAGTEITQDASMMGNALKTISMRIRGYDEETGELSDGLKTLTGDIADLTKTANNPQGISLFTNENRDTYKSTYEILREISNIWDELTDKQQADLLDKLFGKTRAQAGASIISNFEKAEEAMQVMATSAGNADEEMEIIKNSLEYKINALKETGTGIWQNIFNREDLATAVDGLTKVFDVLDKLTSKLGMFGSFIVGGTILTGIKSLA